VALRYRYTQAAIVCPPNEKFAPLFRACYLHYYTFIKKMRGCSNENVTRSSFETFRPGNYTSGTCSNIKHGRPNLFPG
jgi:hypothetical protein